MFDMKKYKFRSADMVWHSKDTSKPLVYEVLLTSKLGSVVRIRIALN